MPRLNDEQRIYYESRNGELKKMVLAAIAAQHRGETKGQFMVTNAGRHGAEIAWDACEFFGEDGESWAPTEPRSSAT